MPGSADDEAERAELASIATLVDELFRGLDTLPYHEFLGVDEAAAGDALRQAFHARAQLFHPDRFYQLGDQALRTQIYEVYKRVTEAYRVLGDPEARRQYQEQRRQGKNRLDRSERPASALRRPEDAVTNPQAKKYFGLGLDAERRGDTRGAKLNFQLALQMEPGNAVLKDKLEKLK
jgi:DnaJ-class molecular chaperone